MIEDFENNPQYEFESINFSVDKKIIEKIEYGDILKQIFNAKSPAKSRF